MSTKKNGSIDLSFQAGKGYRKDCGKELDPATGRSRYRRFWLGHDQKKAIMVAKVILGEWALIRTHGGEYWTADALRRIDEAKNGIAETVATVAMPPTETISPAVSVVTTAQVASAAPAVRSLAPTSGASKWLYDAIDEYVKFVKAEAEAGQLSDGRCCNASYSMTRLKFAVSDQPLAAMGFDQIRAIVTYFTARPVSKTGRKFAPDTIIDTLSFIRAFFSYATDRKHWSPPIEMGKLFKYRRDKLYTDAEREKKERVLTFSVGELVILWQSCANRRQHIMFLLALNCGFTQTEIATLRWSHCRLDGTRPSIRRRRNKTLVKGRWRLWPETAELLREEQTTAAGRDLVLVSKSGRPMVHYDDGVRHDHVRNEWRKVLKSADRRHELYQELDGWRPAHQLPKGHVPPVKVQALGFKHLRKTGSSMVRKIAGRDIAEVYLCHVEPKMSRPYNSKDFGKLTKALRKMRRVLEPALGPVAQVQPEPAR